MHVGDEPPVTEGYRIDMRPEHLVVVRDILYRHLPNDARVGVFGSRINGSAVKSSDLDLAVESSRPINNRDMALLEMAFDESHFPYTVDVVDMKTVGSKFGQIINDQKVPFPAETPADIAAV